MLRKGRINSHLLVKFKFLIGVVGCEGVVIDFVVDCVFYLGKFGLDVSDFLFELATTHGDAAPLCVQNVGVEPIGTFSFGKK